ncbi:unnamed protein product [Brachionus calyciflorus]|uniref:SCP domain-containing protein n=1 Tax=Brachionus calyciflorus TaxID=104777 RepID=A0A813MDZ3_9BILA|nr:unnamed protein product [Brachionus calyciflorus]
MLLSIVNGRLIKNELTVNDAIKFIQEMVNQHNILRQNHNVSDLVLNPDLVQLAQNEADKYADNGVMDSQIVKYKNTGLGKNSAIYAGPAGYSGIQPTNLWYQKSQKFNYASNSIQDSGTFTQVVWKNSKEIGVGVTKKDNKFYIVALYNPPGNILGTVTQNVLPPLNPSKPTSSSTEGLENLDRSDLIKKIKDLLTALENN